jgi:hypothetical protein
MEETKNVALATAKGWTDLGVVETLSYDTANRTIVVQHVYGEERTTLKCRIAGYERDEAAKLWKALKSAQVEKDLVYLGAKGNWSPTAWFCAIENHTQEYLAAEEWASNSSRWDHFLEPSEHLYMMQA